LTRSDHTPWAHGQIRLPPIGLRETVLRAAHRARCQSPLPTRTPLERLVAGWHAGHDCTPAQWRHLVAICEGRSTVEVEVPAA